MLSPMNWEIASVSILGCCRGSCLLGLVVLLAGCAGPRLMMPTPNVYLDAEHDVFAELDPSISTTQVKLFYITDREPEQNEDGILRYGTG